ncbi:MAG: SUMF1/EgtB/PvdO family nonheme iron enzyme [Elainellaceae cyanobacterium]
MTERQFDVFLCHNSEDKPAVIEIAEQLRHHQLKPWLDVWELRPGVDWQEILEEQIRQINCVAVFVGEAGLGPWQKREMRAYIRAFVKQDLPVIPVLLPSAPVKPTLPIFLEGFHWVDFREPHPEPMTQLIWGITGRKPTQSSSPSVSATPSSSSALKSFSFEVAKVNAQGKEIQRQRQQAQYFAENLGNGVTLEMVQIPSGTCWIGQTSAETQELIRQVGEEKYQTYFARELPRHRVNVSPFSMGKFPVTQAQYEAVMGTNPATQYDNDRFVVPDKPVVGVSWHDAIAFCERLSQQTKTEYRLPSEAEWEYACRAGTQTPFHFGETITTDLANYNGNYIYGSAPKGEYREKPTPVGSFSANAFGLFDMHGTVLEWCLDYWHENYQDAPTDGSAWNIGGDSDIRILRGGSWFNNPTFCRSANRSGSSPGDVFTDVGFRVVCVSA